MNFTRGQTGRFETRESGRLWKTEGPLFVRNSWSNVRATIAPREPVARGIQGCSRRGKLVQGSSPAGYWPGHPISGGEGLTRPPFLLSPLQSGGATASFAKYFYQRGLITRMCTGPWVRSGSRTSWRGGSPDETEKFGGDDSSATARASSLCLS